MDLQTRIFFSILSSILFLIRDYRRYLYQRYRRARTNGMRMTRISKRGFFSFYSQSILFLIRDYRRYLYQRYRRAINIGTWMTRFFFDP
jgi:hypothetical protein